MIGSALEGSIGAGELSRVLAEVKGQSQFLLYLADQIEDSLGQMSSESDESQVAFLGKILSMYGCQLEQKHQSMGTTIAQACREVRTVVATREADVLV